MIRKILEKANIPNKNRTAFTSAMLGAVVFHVIVGVIAGTIMIVHEFTEEAEDFEEPPVIAAPQKKPEYQVNIQKLKKQSSPPRTRTITVHNPNDIELPTLDVPQVDTSFAITGRGTGGFGNGIGASEMKFDITLFGMDIPSGKLGIILDVSYSGHDELPYVYDELLKFPDAEIVLASGCGIHPSSKALMIPAKEYVKKLDDYYYDGMGKGKGKGSAQLSGFIKGIISKHKIDPDSGTSLSILWQKFAVDRRKLYVAHVDLRKYPKDLGHVATQDIFRYLQSRGCRTIYWFADFQDSIHAGEYEALVKQMVRSGVTVHQHEFDKSKCSAKIRLISQLTGGEYIHAPPSKLKREEMKRKAKAVVSR